MKVKLSNSHRLKPSNGDEKITLTIEIDFCAWISGKLGKLGKLLGGRKERDSDSYENSQDEHGKNAAFLHIYSSVLLWYDFCFYICIYLLPV